MTRRKGKDENVSVAVTRGRRIDYLGYCFTYENTRVRKSIKQNFARKNKKEKLAKKRRDIRASYWGWLKWCKGRHLWNKLTDSDMSFIKHGITGRVSTKEGQEFFDVKSIKADAILNMPIKVISFITDVKTKNGPGRYVVKIEFDGVEYKFITNSFTLKSMLEQAKELNILPTETRLRKRDIGNGRYDYIFE